MATVTLATLWLNDASNLVNGMSFPYMSKLASTLTQPGGVKRYANGRLRAVLLSGTQEQLAVDLPACSRSQIAWLEAHVGDLVLVRDDRGRKFYAVYLTVPAAEHGYNSDGDVALTLQQVTYSEVV